LKSRVLSLAALGLAGALLAACEEMPLTPPPLTPPPPPPPPPTPAEEFAWSTQHGNNALAVTMAYRPGGQLWSCAGQTEALMPETSYSRSRILTLYGSAERAVLDTTTVRARSAANTGADYGQYVRTAACDAQDMFSFTGLPDGAYFVIAQVHQVRPANPAGQKVVMQRVEVAGGQPVRLVLPTGGRAPPPPPPRRRPGQ
jgi:hypothetical protein